MAEPVLSIALETLGDLLVEEAKFLSGVSDQVGKIQAELGMMKGFLKDADKKQHKDERVCKWVSEVQDLCYEIEDVLEKFAVEVASKRSGKGIKKFVKRFACLLSEGIALHKVGDRIARIQDRLSNLRTISQTYGIQQLVDGESSKDANEQQWWLRQTFAHEPDEHFVGMQNEFSQLVSLMVDNNRNHKIISICGMGGLGKTTLARKIYNHAKVKDCFEAFAWCCISQHCNVKVVLQDLLKQLPGESKEEVKDMNEAQLVRELYKVQTEKKCLIVLDDIWKINQWNMMSKAFVDADQAKSKILLATRKEDVAELGFLYKLRNLTQDEGWQLIQKKVFAGQEERDVKRDPEFESVGRQIVGKCGGLPLAISVLGGILKSRNTLSEWQRVRKDVDSYLNESEGDRESPVHVLALSYNDLPYNLKSCFLYMGIFQEDEEIEARKLYHLWIAEGLVSSKHRGNEETMMNVAECNLSELASRSMVQVRMDNLSMVGRIKSCKLHDLMRDLCLKKGKGEQFLENLRVDNHGDTSSLPNTSARRLAIYFGGGQKKFDRREEEGILGTKFDRSEEDSFGILSLAQITNQFLRALSVHNATLRGPPNLKSCRVLDFQSCLFHKNKLPKEISKMVHLRSLSVNDCHLDKLPSFIGDLQYLETLDLRTNFKIHLANNMFSKMKRLKHLYLDKFDCGSEKLQLNGLSGLQTLVGFDSETVSHKDLSELVNLQYFNADLGSDDWSIIINHIDSWKKIKWVRIQIGGSSLWKLLLCHNLNDLEVYGSLMGKLPRYEPQFWPNLIRLYLRRTEIDEESMEFLKKLPKLQQLILVSYAFIGKEFICDATNFPQLRSLEILVQHNLEKWRMDEGALPNLSSLVIDYCKKLEIIPEDGLRYLTNLKELQIRNMPEVFKQKYGILTRGFEKAQHEIS